MSDSSDGMKLKILNPESRTVGFDFHALSDQSFGLSLRVLKCGVRNMRMRNETALIQWAASTTEQSTGKVQMFYFRVHGSSPKPPRWDSTVFGKIGEIVRCTPAIPKGAACWHLCRAIRADLERKHHSTTSLLNLFKLFVPLRKLCSLWGGAVHRGPRPTNAKPLNSRTMPEGRDSFPI